MFSTLILANRLPIVPVDSSAASNPFPRVDSFWAVDTSSSWYWEYGSALGVEPGDALSDAKDWCTPDDDDWRGDGTSVGTKLKAVVDERRRRAERAMAKMVEGQLTLEVDRDDAMIGGVLLR
jgi:hypothetical protein